MYSLEPKEGYEYTNVGFMLENLGCCFPHISGFHFPSPTNRIDMVQIEFYIFRRKLFLMVILIINS